MSDVQSEMFPVARPTQGQIIAAALAHQPVAIFAMFSGGDGSLETTEWCMTNVPGCEVLHITTGIGIRRTGQFVRDTCVEQRWKLTEMHAKDDCGQDYEAIVRQYGFPGPAGHQFMYRRLKERCVELVVKRRKAKRRDKVMLITGIRHDDSQRRTGYGGREVSFKGAQMWVNPFYWVPKTDMARWSIAKGIPRNPVSIELGMSGECLCGAYASEGELNLVRQVDPQTAAYIHDLETEVRALGHDWGWEQGPPEPPADTLTIDMFSPMCVDCMKSPQRLSP